MAHHASSRISFEPSAVHRWEWINAPESWKATPEVLSVDTPPGTDWLRSARAVSSTTDPEGADRGSAPVYAFPVRGDFRASVQVQGRWRGDWDQAGLFLIQGGGECPTWLKLGVEHDGGYEFVATVIADPYSDWSCYPLPIETTALREQHGQSLIIILEKRSHHLWISIGIPTHNDLSDSDDMDVSELEEGYRVQGIREYKGFAMHTNDTTWWRLGVMAASPPGGKGTGLSAQFTNFCFEPL